MVLSLILAIQILLFCILAFGAGCLFGHMKSEKKYLVSINIFDSNNNQNEESTELDPEPEPEQQLITKNNNNKVTSLLRSKDAITT